MLILKYLELSNPSQCIFVEYICRLALVGLTNWLSHLTHLFRLSVVRLVRIFEATRVRIETTSGARRWLRLHLLFLIQ